MALIDVVPVLKVDDLDAAVAFYTRLGFAETFRWGEPPFYAGMTAGDLGPDADSDLHLNVSKDDPGKGEIYISVDEVDELYQRIRQEGADVTNELRDQPYGMRDFSLRDPAGNFVTVGMPLPVDEAGDAAS